jgi:peptidoglycan hydrolase CwlO-like protein
MAGTPTSATLGAIMAKMDTIIEGQARLERRLDVHDEKHKALDKEHTDFDATLRRLLESVSSHDKQLSQVKTDLDRLTSNLNKIIWAVVSPVIAAAVIAIILLIGQQQ